MSSSRAKELKGKVFSKAFFSAGKITPSREALCPQANFSLLWPLGYKKEECSENGIVYQNRVFLMKGYYLR